MMISQPICKVLRWFYTGSISNHLSGQQILPDSCLYSDLFLILFDKVEQSQDKRWIGNFNGQMNWQFIYCLSWLYWSFLSV